MYVSVCIQMAITDWHSSDVHSVGYCTESDKLCLDTKQIQSNTLVSWCVCEGTESHNFGSGIAKRKEVITFSAWLVMTRCERMRMKQMQNLDDGNDSKEASEGEDQLGMNMYSDWSG